MLNFKPLAIEDRELFSHYLGDYKFSTYEYSFLNLYLWRKYCEVEYTVLDGALIIKKTEEGKGTFFMEPLGYEDEDIRNIITKLLDYQKGCAGMVRLFADVEEPFLNTLTTLYGERAEAIPDVKNFDYIYEADRLIKLSGDKLRKRKNQYNQFVRNYRYCVKDISEDNCSRDCIDFAKRWLGDIDDHYQLQCETEGIEDVLENSEELGALGMGVYVRDQMVGFTIGEKAKDDLAIIHVEKADADYKGAYAFINRTFARQYLKDVKYINREEDIGIPGLRRAKLAYDPIRLEKKFLVNLRGE